MTPTTVPNFARCAFRKEKKAVFIEPDSLWQNGRIERFFDKLRDELLNPELFFSGAEMEARLDEHAQYYNQHRPRSLKS